jgi:hypothetical protein
MKLRWAPTELLVVYLEGDDFLALRVILRAELVLLQLKLFNHLLKFSYLSGVSCCLDFRLLHDVIFSRLC